MWKITLVVIAIIASSSEALIARSQRNNKVLEDNQKCTSIGVGRLAMADGSTVTTHNNDCQECDIRITHVPAMDWPKGALRPIHDIRDHYPRYFEDPGSDLNIHGPDYAAAKVDTTIYNWSYVQPIGFIDQIPHTYAYTLGTYAIQNEKQVSIGESTCSGKFVAKPVHMGGRALFHMETLTEIALERCDTARCAITTMGDLALQYGFYGGGWDGDLEGGQDEAGEALTISDANETWMFHLLADDTGTSAVWVAQRVPDEHITAVANQFVIYEIDLNDKDNFMGSANIYDVAIRNNLWSPDSMKPFNFARVYGNDRGHEGFACTRRVWRVFTLAAPSLLSVFTPFTDGLGTFGFGAEGKEPYPFSVKPDKPLKVQDIMNMNRDQYEGTQFDLTQGPGGGPFGDPMRWPTLQKWEDKVEGVSPEAEKNGLSFQRPISLWRTAYSTVTQSRASLPDAVGAVTWIAPYAPHHSTFVPVYASRWYIYTIRAINELQQEIEEDLFSSQVEMEKKAVEMSQKAHAGTTAPPATTKPDATKPSTTTRRALTETTASRKVVPVSSLTTHQESVGVFLAKYHELQAMKVKEKWWDFFFDCVGRFRDMYEVVDPHVENFIDSYEYLGAPRWWFEQIGFWGAPGTPSADEEAPVPIHSINVPSLPSQKAYKEEYPRGFDEAYAWSPPSTANGGGIAKKIKGGLAHDSFFLMAMVFAMGGMVGGALVAICMKGGNKGYTPIK